MFKKLCFTFLSVCLATAMVLGAIHQFSCANKQDTVTMCIMDVEEELY